jgi:hypothetical protein
MFAISFPQGREFSQETDFSGGLGKDENIYRPSPR